MIFITDLLKEIVSEIKMQAEYISDKDPGNKDFNPSCEFGMLLGYAESLETIKRIADENDINFMDIGFSEFDSYDLLKLRPMGWDPEKSLVPDE